LYQKSVFLGTFDTTLPLPLKGKGEDLLKEGLTPLLNTPLSQAHYQGGVKAREGAKPPLRHPKK
jgi:hypothetical protein